MIVGGWFNGVGLFKDGRILGSCWVHLGMGLTCDGGYLVMQNLMMGSSMDGVILQNDFNAIRSFCEPKTRRILTNHTLKVLLTIPNNSHKRYQIIVTNDTKELSQTIPKNCQKRYQRIVSNNP